jgi:shikimate kinase
MPAAAAPRQIALLGLMAVGKTTVGRLLAASLGRLLSDSDAQIQALEGLTVREIQERSGTDALHELEARILLEALARPEPSVICAAASTIDDERCRRALDAPEVTTVWLQATLATLVERYDRDAHRPRYPQGTEAALAGQLAARTPRFEAVADVTIAVDGLAPPAIAAALEPLIAECERPPQ